jgi:hypothetical protein
LPAGFSYVAGSASVDSGGNGAQVSGDADGQTVTFTLIAVDSFTYSVSVGSDVEDRQHDFSGVFKDSPLPRNLEGLFLRIRCRRAAN